MKLKSSSLLMVLSAALCAWAQKVEVNWEQVERISKTRATLQVVVNPPLRRGPTIHDRVFQELRQLGADYVRYVPWLPYPRLGVAELEPPAQSKVFWDFKLIDPMTVDFLEATQGHPVILNFSTIPQWMFRTSKPVTYPADPDEAVWNYTQGTELRDPTTKELGDYYARLVSWYVNGGFEDEMGVKHVSGHHYKIDYWEVFNEPDIEHNTTPEQYTQRYDAVVAAIRKVAPKTKFVGISVAFPSGNPRMFEYFLDPRNHKPGTPLDMISYHFYASPAADQSEDSHQFTFFDQADRFITTAEYIEQIRLRLSPTTATTVNEIGSILPGDPRGKLPIPDSYWNLSAACYAYVFGHLNRLGIDIAGESQLVGYPTQFPSVSMVDWNTGAPNARFRVLELLMNSFGPGDNILKSASAGSSVYAQAVIRPKGERRLLLVNKRNREFTLKLPFPSAKVQVVDQTTGGGPIATRTVNDGQLLLPGYAVAVVTFPAQ